MRRKVIKQGNGSYTITLPKKWVDLNNIGKDSELSATIDNGDLILNSGTTRPLKTISLSLDQNNTSTLRRVLTNAYRTGYDKLLLNIHSSMQQNVEDLLQSNLIGFEITEAKENSIIIENITEPSFDHFESISIKFLQSISQYFLITKDLLQQKNVEGPVVLEKQIIRYANYLRRCISKDASQLFGHWQFFSLLLYAQRECKSMIKQSETINISDITLIDACIESMDLLKKSYYKKDLRALNTSEKNLLLFYEKFEKIKKITVLDTKCYSAYRFLHHCNTTLTTILFHLQAAK